MACKAWPGLKGSFKDMDTKFFSMSNPNLPKAMYASDRTFVVDSGASFHLIGHNKLTQKEQATVRTVEEPFRIQSANGTITVKEEARIYVPALEIWIWAQLVEDCPAVLSLGTLCGKQGWNYEWKSGDHPTMSKGSKSITLTPHHDVPMILSSQESENSEDSTEDTSSSSACGGRPHAQEKGEETPAEAEERNAEGDLSLDQSPSTTTTSQETSKIKPTQTSSEECTTQEKRDEHKK